SLDGGDAFEPLRLLHQTAQKALAERLVPDAIRADDAHERIIRAAYASDPRLGLWYWFLTRTVELDPERADEANVRLELIVALYYLRASSPLGGRSPA
ncbi:MAG: hypothetical protein ACOC0O_05205, partial [Spirochaetota bacterium]